MKKNGKLYRLSTDGSEPEKIDILLAPDLNASSEAGSIENISEPAMEDGISSFAPCTKKDTFICVLQKHGLASFTVEKGSKEA